MFLGIVSVSAVCLVLAYSGWDPQDFPTDFETNSYGKCIQQETNAFTSWTDSIVQWLQFDDRKQKPLDSGGIIKIPPDKYNSNDDDETLKEYIAIFKNSDDSYSNNSIHRIPLRVKYELDREYRGRIVYRDTTILEAWSEKCDDIDQDDSIIAYGDTGLENINKEDDIMGHDKGVISYQEIWQKADVRSTFRKAENILAYKTENMSRDADRFYQDSSFIGNLLAFFSDCYFYFTSSRETRDIPTNGMGAEKADNFSGITGTIYDAKNGVENDYADDADYINYRTYNHYNTRDNTDHDTDWIGYRGYHPNITWDNMDHNTDYMDYRLYNPDNTRNNTGDDAHFFYYRTYNPVNTMDIHNTGDDEVYMDYITYNPGHTRGNTGYYHSYATISDSDGYPFHDNEENVDGTEDCSDVRDNDTDDVDDNDSLTLKMMIVYLAAVVFKYKIMDYRRGRPNSIKDSDSDSSSDSDSDSGTGLDAFPAVWANIGINLPALPPERPPERALPLGPWDDVSGVYGLDWSTVPDFVLDDCQTCRKIKREILGNKLINLSRNLPSTGSSNTAFYEKLVLIAAGFIIKNI